MISTDGQAPRAPSNVLFAVEFGRAATELLALMATAPFLTAAPKGDGHDVLVLPGFALSDVSTVPLRHYLKWLGYRTHGWGFGRNFGPRSIGEGGERLAEAIDRLTDGGRRKISLVGHSLGGVMARLYALDHPDVVRQVICLGSPFVADPRMVNKTVASLYERLTGDADGPASSTLRAPPGVPCTAIFSRTDGLVTPANCTEAPSARAENIEVYGSHVGLIANPAVFYAVADRLSLPRDQWRPFDNVGWRRWAYGTHQRFAPAPAEAA